MTRMHAVFNGTVVAESNRTEVAEGNHSGLASHHDVESTPAQAEK